MERPGRKDLLMIVWISLVFVVMIPCSSLILFIWVISFFFIFCNNHLLDSLVVCNLAVFLSCWCFVWSLVFLVLTGFWFGLFFYLGILQLHHCYLLCFFWFFIVVLIPINFPLIVVHSWLGQLVAPLYWKFALYLLVPWELVLKKGASRPIPAHGIVNITIMLS